MSQKNYIIEQLEQEIANYTPSESVRRIGTVVEVFDGIVRATGLSEVQSSEMVKFETGVYGIALNLEEGVVGIIVLGDYMGITEGQTVEATGNILEIPVSNELCGRVVDAMAQPVDGKGDLPQETTAPIEKKAPGVITRQSVSEPVQTGIKAIDALIPIGRGQRELIIGDRQTGKTTLAIDTILNQKEEDMICVYVSIGQKESKLRTLQRQLEQEGAMDYTVIVNASASTNAAENFIAPYSGMAIAEYFMGQGKDVLIVFDDLSKHAVAYREISLLLRRPPGREAFPGDIFYIHSRLLERSARLNEEHGGGSITALPIIETQAGDVSAYVPTNVISITDGQIFLETDLFYKGMRPAINVGLSVSRVGSSAQRKAMKKVAGTLKLDLAQYRELEAFAQFGSDLDQKTKEQLERGKRSMELLKQPQYSPLIVEHQVAIFYALTRGYLDRIPVEQISTFQEEWIAYVDANVPNFFKEIREDGMWKEETEKQVKEALEIFSNNFLKQA